MRTKLYQKIAIAGEKVIRLRKELEEANKNAWDSYYRLEDSLIIANDDLAALGYHLRTGSGFDVSPTITKASDSKIVIKGSYHIMDHLGMYVGWIDFFVTVKPSLVNRFSLDVKLVHPEHYPHGSIVGLKDYITQYYCEEVDQDIENEDEDYPVN